MRLMQNCLAIIPQLSLHSPGDTPLPMSLSIIALQVGRRLLEIASDMKMSIFLLAVIAYLGYRSTLPAIPAKVLLEATLESERIQRELFEEEERLNQQPHTQRVTSPMSECLRRKKKKSKRKESVPQSIALEETSNKKSYLEEEITSNAQESSVKVESIVQEEEIPRTPPSYDENQLLCTGSPAANDTNEVSVNPAEEPVPTTPKKKNKKKKGTRSAPSSTKEFILESAPEIDWNDVKIPVKSSPGSTASTSSSSSSSKAHPSLSPVRTTSKTILLLSPVKKPLALARSQSTVTDGRSWRDALGIPEPLVLTKMASFGAVPIHPPLPRDPPPSSNSELKQIVQQIEFYFSDFNLQKDFFLRNRMDTEGFVYINVVLNFNRVKAISQFQKFTPTIPELLSSLENSPTLEIQCKRLPSGAIDPEFAQLAKIRPAKSWETWIPMNPLPSRHPFELLSRRTSSTAFAKST